VLAAAAALVVAGCGGSSSSRKGPPALLYVSTQDDDYAIFEQGTWATWVEAGTWEDAEAAAVKGMKEDDDT